ncbi:MAG: TIGR00282 family metallophosphoesterase [candidate division Zixibacteria bacterium]|nr:TIGR00282 family metallophosphoesterase [candidate division Zixibacteria bacterium]
MSFTILFVADICGRVGRQAAAHMIKPLREKHSADFVIANIENAAGGFGVTPPMSQKAFSYGIDVQTSGNHIWDRQDIIDYLHDKPKLLRPANFPIGAPGLGSYVQQVGDVRVAVLNLMGRTYMKDIDCPFKVADRELNQIDPDVNIVFVDFHAEATSEKQALFYYLDGKISAIVGTHTHVQTADEQVSARGTAYITDAGMTGPFDSIIGMQKKPALERFLTGMPKRFTTASDDIRISGVIVDIDAATGRAERIERYCEKFDIRDAQSLNEETD